MRRTAFSSLAMRRTVPRRRGTVVALLVLALLWAQLLGLAHGVLHAVPAWHARAGLASPQVVAAAPAPDLLSHLFAPVGSERDCRLYDQLGHGAPLPALPAALALAPPQAVAWVLPQAGPPRPCAAFTARAPPSFR